MSRIQVEPWGNRTVTLRCDRVRQLRQAAGLSQMALALNSLGSPHYLSESTIKRAEAGREVYLETASRLAGLLGVQVRDLLEEDAGLTQAGVALGVLPFAAVSGDPFAKTVALGLHQDLTTRLSQCWFPIIAMRTMDTVATALPSQHLFKELDVAYLLEGAIQLTATRYRATLRLHKADGTVQFATQQDFSAGNELEVQDDLMAALVGNLSAGIVKAEYARLHAPGEVNLDAWGAAVRGVHLLRRHTSTDNQAARDLFQLATDMDTSLVAPAYFLAVTHQRDFVNGWSDPANALTKYHEALSRFGRHHSGHPLHDLGQAYLATYGGNHSLAMAFAKRSIERAPNCDQAYCLLGQLFAMGGRAEEATETLEIAHRLCPKDADGAILLARALTNFVAERYEAARNAAQLALSSQSCTAPSLALMTLAASSALAGDLATARSVTSNTQLRGRNFDSLRMMVGSTLPEIAARFMKGLELAGLRPSV